MARRIFRESALEHYNERLEKIELPRYASAPWMLLMWLAVLLLLLTTALLLAVRLPEFAVGPGVVVDGDSLNRKAPGAAVAAFLPSEYAGRLSPGQAAEIILPGREASEARLLAVEPAPLSPATARERYGLDPATGSLLRGPVIVVVIDVDRYLAT